MKNYFFKRAKLRNYDLNDYVLLDNDVSDGIHIIVYGMVKVWKVFKVQVLFIIPAGLSYKNLVLLYKKKDEFFSLNYFFKL